MVPFLLLVLAAIWSTVSAVPSITALGSKFFTSEGNQFFIKGKAYRNTTSDDRY
jgi:hypothetical protein